MTTDNDGQQQGDQGATPPSPPAGQQPDPPQGGGNADLAKVQAALNKERELRRTAERQARDGEAAKTRLAELEQAAQSDTEKAVTVARREATAEAMAKANTRLVAAEARAAAAVLRFQDPRDVALVDLSDIHVADDGTVDTDAITTRLRDLAEAKPYLVAAQVPAEPAGPRPPMPDPSQGSGRPSAPTGAERGLEEAQRRFGNRAPAATGN